MSISGSLTSGDRAPPTGAIIMASTPASRRKTAPTHPGEIIADMLDEQNVSPRVAAKAIRMSHTGLVKALKGLSPVTAETALRIAVYFQGEKHATPEIWLRMQADYDLYQARQRIGADLKAIRKIGT